MPTTEQRLKNIAVISDVHGCFKTLMALVKKLPQDYEVILCGDLIDRGPSSQAVVEWAMDNSIRTVMGNHEDLMLWNYGMRYADMPYSEDDIWHFNGASETLSSFGGEVPKSVLEWANKLPFFIREEDFEISHTGLGSAANRATALWYREGSDGEALLHNKDGVFRVFGHTQQKEPRIEKNYAMIDTGCAYKNRGMGVLTAFLLPDKKVIQQEYIDDQP